MELPFVSRGRYEDMRDRALSAEARLDRALEGRIVNDRAQVVQLPPQTELPPEVRDELYPLPPVVDEAIRNRVPAGSQLQRALIDQARDAIERMGPDFDDEAYANTIMRGTRVSGWPM